jgi:hypothetical protein
VSNELSIAAVTSTLRSLLHGAADATLPGTPVTTRPLDKARDGFAEPQLNLFLYHTAIDAAWRNMDMPGVLNGEPGFPPLPLTLHYLVTAYGKEDDDSDDHRLLGVAMRALHDHPLLGPAELRATLPESDLYRQVERVRITSQPLSLDEMSKLWTAFQTQYRVSAAYEVSVVLIESHRPNGSGPPVIMRGAGDVGVVVRPDLLLPIATLEEVAPATVDAGGTIELTGHDLGGDTIRLRFTHPALGDPLYTAPTPAPSGLTYTATLPVGVPAGIATVAAVIDRRGHELATNELPLAIRPKVTSALPLAAQRDANGHVSISVDVTPAVLAGQDVFLLAFGRQLRADPFPGPTNSISFSFSADAGASPMRIRIGGTDTQLILAGPPLAYDEDQRLEIT